MKKTLIALAVAASAAVSGSAMAWTASGAGGSVDLGGTLTPTDVTTPWEVKTGAAVSGLDASIKRGVSSVNISVNNAIPVLGIRVADATSKVFSGAAGITPQINYHDAVNIDGFNDGVTTLTLDVNDDAAQKIGSLSVPFTAVGFASWRNATTGNGNAFSTYSSTEGQAFFGGVGKSSSAVTTSGNAESVANALSPEFTANFTDQTSSVIDSYYTDFTSEHITYSAFYGSGINTGSVITINLDSPFAGDSDVVWKASLPVEVVYQ
ncbi:F4 family fimbrial subunit [Escherichia coli]|uniref:F4 family fimbrial subunit n=1 Tax=Escherichia coli TaxID=562 RepID=UPI001E43551E|nr:fimbrial protein [Escherichia coli]